MTATVVTAPLIGRLATRERYDRPRLGAFADGRGRAQGADPGPVLRFAVRDDAIYVAGVASGLATGLAPSPSTVKGCTMPSANAGSPVSGSKT